MCRLHQSTNVSLMNDSWHNPPHRTQICRWILRQDPPKERFVSKLGSRRNFFDRIRLGLPGLAITRALPFETAAAAQTPAATPLQAPTAAPVDYYEKLGVTKRINAAGTYTYLTGCL